MGLTATTEAGVFALVLPQRQKVVLVMDLVESVRLMAAHEVAVIDYWRGFVHHATGRVLPRHGGRLVKSLGDGIMGEFDSARDAVAAALELQGYFDEANASLGPDEKLYLRAGLHASRVFVDDLDIYGSGVNLAARVAGLAGPGETMVTAEVRDELVEGLDARVEDMGECHLKHVPLPVRVYRAGPAGAVAVLRPLREYKSELQPTIAVIPFSGRPADAATRSIGDLIADGVIAQLGRTPQLKVISRLSASAFRDRPDGTQAFFTLLGADYVLSGNYHVRGQRIICSAELAETRTGTVLWMDQAEGQVDDLFSLHAELPHRIANGAHAALMNSQALAATTTPLPTLQSYSILLGSIQLMHQSSRAGFERSREALDYLVERHPRSSVVRAWRANWSVLQTTRGLGNDPAAEAQRALDQTRRALDSEPENALALAIEGFVYCHLKSDFDTAHQRIRSALEADPSCSLGWLFMATVQGFRGETAEAVTSAERAMALSPLDPIKYYYHCLHGSALLYDMQVERARDELLRSWRLNKYHAPTIRLLAVASVEMGDMAFAREMVLRLLAVEPGLTVERYLARRPAVNGIVERFAKALAEAGLPSR
jgi:class 3 adenylate cyclase/TolB-like protein